MTTHKVRKIYGENVCMVCARSWEDGDEVPECHPTPKVPYTRYVGKEYRQDELEAMSKPVNVFMLYGANNTASVAYAKTERDAVILGTRFFGPRLTGCAAAPASFLDFFVEGRDPYVEANPRNILHMNDRTPSGPRIVSPIDFKREYL